MSTMAPAKGRSQRFAEFEEKLAQDYDPEAEAPVEESDDSQSEDGSDELDGTEHYVSVGKSKLRRTDPVSLGPRYSGKRVSRAALDDSSEEEEDDEDDEATSGEDEDEEFADPETADLKADHVDRDEEIDSDDALCESDQEKFAKFTFRGSSKPKLTPAQRRQRPTAADFLSDSEEEGLKADSDDSIGDEDEEEEGESEDGLGQSDSEDGSGLDDDTDSGSDDDGSEDEDDTDGTSGDESEAGGADKRAELRKIMSEGQKSIVSTMSEAAKADAEKGSAVRQQRRSFDALLNIRIRLQKALVAVNSLGTISESDQDLAGDEPYQAAEEAALKLWSTVETFRCSLPTSSAAASGKKRKRELGLDTPLGELWEDMEAIESRAASHRKKVLEKWSNKVRSTTAVATSRKLGNATVQRLTSVLDDQLVQSDRLVKRTRVPRSCAPVQMAKKVQEDEGIYDDADFYQLLLKELVDQRTTDSGGDGGPGGSSVPTVRWGAAAQEAKTRKVVDRRASKGRKLRFTVHEKLQNFMAPEDRRGWGQEAIDRFFGTLFGQKMELREDDGSEDEEMGGNLEEEGLRLFR
ncbi:transcription factor AATF/Che-1 [Gaeumannomyces tritici R3-111a-1]|uniref:Protein BFR2 n=1 Tax=Gaeumannomyces tritici (strain R3-111a-1) TaxID=644352 RepID=J3NIU8_GAET3|nr:transcription factor AATF/Che-1 [Gaeumannomyces tritici R3-111a-1]EJT81198.1 transcription factor AATF/Che-1 [Gaeumannomyces tritici R3-111a-1]